MLVSLHQTPRYNSEDLNILRILWISLLSKLLFSFSFFLFLPFSLPPFPVASLHSLPFWLCHTFELYHSTYFDRKSVVLPHANPSSCYLDGLALRSSRIDLSTNWRIYWTCPITLIKCLINRLHCSDRQNPSNVTRCFYVPDIFHWWLPAQK